MAELTDTQASIGKILTKPMARDAIHIAVAPIVAQVQVWPSQAVDEAGLPHGGTPVGLVDPFLPGPVQPGQRFWLFLYPNTITSLRHVWVHPAFGTKSDTPAGRSMAIERLAEALGSSYDRTIGYLETYARYGEREGFGYDIDYLSDDEMRLVWRDFERITGIEPPQDRTGFPFSCAC